MNVAPIQRQGPTVGDTIWIGRGIAVPAGMTLRPADWTLQDSMQILGPPRVTVRGDSAYVAYPIVVWRPGTRTIEVPGPYLLGSGGRVDSLPPQMRSLTITAVLPAAPADSVLQPQPRAEFVPGHGTSPLPPALLVGLAFLLLAPLHWWWRRRGPIVSPRQDGPPELLPPFERWASVGETRAVAGAASAQLRAAIGRRFESATRTSATSDLVSVLAAERPHWPVTEIDEILQGLDRARFARASVDDTLALARRAAAMSTRLSELAS